MTDMCTCISTYRQADRVAKIASLCTLNTSESKAWAILCNKWPPDEDKSTPCLWPLLLPSNVANSKRDSYDTLTEIVIMRQNKITSMIKSIEHQETATPMLCCPGISCSLTCVTALWATSTLLRVVSAGSSVGWLRRKSTHSEGPKAMFTSTLTLGTVVIEKASELEATATKICSTNII